MYILYAVLLPAVTALPLLLIYLRYKRGRSAKNPLIANLVLFFAVLVSCGLFFLKQGVAAATADSLVSSDGFATGMGYFAAALAVGLSGLAGGKAVSSTASAAIGALTENEGTFGKALVFVGMAEGIALYGMLVAFIIVSNLG